VYLAIDPSDPELIIQVFDRNGWMFACITWLDKKGYPRISISVDLGDLGEYVRSKGGELYIEWPEWLALAIKHGRVTFESASVRYTNLENLE